MHTKKKGHKVAVLLLGLALAVLLLVGAWVNWEEVRTCGVTTLLGRMARKALREVTDE